MSEPAALTPQERDELRAVLEKLGSDLAQALRGLDEGARTVDLDEPIGRLSRMDALQQQSMARANAEASRARLRQVEAALERWAEGEYGDCCKCGEPIALARLRARPEAPFCIHCQAGTESR